MRQKELIENEKFEKLLKSFKKVYIQLDNGYNDFSYFNGEFHERKFQHWSLDKYYKRFNNFIKTVARTDAVIKNIYLGHSDCGIEVKNNIDLEMGNIFQTL